MNPVEICRKLGEAKTRAIFLELTADPMKKVLREAKIGTARLASHTSTRKRNEDWASRLWRLINDNAPTAPAAAATMIFEWLTRSRRPILSQFLTACEVVHDDGLTDADFMKQTPPEKLVAAAKQLLAAHDPAEVAAYLLFLDASNGSQIFAPLELDTRLAPKA